MGKGYNNFMSKKPFHPASKENIKRVWMAEQRSIDSKKKEDEMRLQYEKEQDLYNNRLLVAGSDSKDKLSLNFMYEAPPGVRKENSKEMETEDEPQYKFEWQRNAPRESFAKNNMDIRDQPFGIQVRNVRCLKCHKWGHVNTDRECPLFNTTSLPAGNPSTDTNKSSSSSATKTSNSGDKPPVKIEPNELIESMKEDQGLALKKSLYGNYGPESMKNNDHHQMLLLNAAVQNPEQSFLESLSSKQKKILLKKLQSLNKSSSSSSKHKTDKKHKKKHKKESSSRKKKSKKVRKSKDSSDSSSSSESDDDRKRNLDKKSRHSDIDRHHQKQYSKNQHSSSSKYSNNDRHNKDRRDDDKDDYHHRRRKSRSRSPENGHHRKRRNPNQLFLYKKKFNF